MTKINWHSIKKEGYPKENGEYLITIKGIGTPNFLCIARFTNNLSKISILFSDKEYKGKKGFYDFDSEYGHYEIENVISWEKIDAYDGE